MQNKGGLPLVPYLEKDSFRVFQQKSKLQLLYKENDSRMLVWSNNEVLF
jgi:hypothetical protein